MKESSRVHFMNKKTNDLINLRTHYKHIIDIAEGRIPVKIGKCEWMAPAWKEALSEIEEILTERNVEFN